MTIDIYTDIAKRLNPEELETLMRFVEAAKAHEWLPTEGRLDLLPSGFLGCKLQDGEVVAALSPFGGLVARAAVKLAKEETEAA
jgi:hypothetical protein